jgi:5'-phosphate synthase pdxT subunit
MKLLDRFGLAEPIRERVKSGMPLWGTCMGLIVAAHDVAGMPDQPTLDLIDVTVRRNAFGRQAASAEMALPIPELGGQAFPAVFIRAPWIERTGPDVQTLASVDGHGVLVRQGYVLGSSFHPEMSPDRRIHAYFLAMVAASAIGKRPTAA